jgi:hypothetical protein
MDNKDIKNAIIEQHYYWINILKDEYTGDNLKDIAKHNLKSLHDSMQRLEDIERSRIIL